MLTISCSLSQSLSIRLFTVPSRSRSLMGPMLTKGMFEVASTIRDLSQQVHVAREAGLCQLQSS
jgi:hypothetical protein